MQNNRNCYWQRSEKGLHREDGKYFSSQACKIRDTESYTGKGISRCLKGMLALIPLFCKVSFYLPDRRNKPLVSLCTGKLEMLDIQQFSC